MRNIFVFKAREGVNKKQVVLNLYKQTESPEEIANQFKGLTPTNIFDIDLEMVQTAVDLLNKEAEGTNLYFGIATDFEDEQQFYDSEESESLKPDQVH